MNIKKLTPVIMIVLLVLAWYAGIRSIMSRPLQYKAHLKKAEQYDKEERYQYAAQEYQAAIDMKPEKQDLYMNLMKDYENLEDYKNMISKCDYIIEHFKENEEAYLAELKYYQEKKQMDSLVEIVKKAVQEHPKNEEIKKYYNQIKKEFIEIYAVYSHISCIENDQALVQDEDGRYGLIYGDGTAFIVPQYEQLSIFSDKEENEEQLAAVKSDGQWYYMDKNEYKAMINENDYDYLGQISEGVMSIAKNDKYGYAVWNQENRSFETKDELQWDYATTMYNGTAAVKKGEKWALIDAKYKEITKFDYDEVVMDEFDICSRRGVVFVKKGDKYQLLNTQGKELTKAEFDDVKPFYKGDMAAVCKDGKWGFVDKEGNLTIKCQYEDADSFSEYYAPVCKDGKWGYITKKNKILIDYQFDGAKPFSPDGIAPVKIDDEWTLIQLYIYE